MLALPVGIALQVLLFVLLCRFTVLGGKQAAVIVAVLAMGVTVPYALLAWPGGDVLAIYVALFLVCAYVLGIISSHRERRLALAGEDTARWFHWGPAVIILFFSVVFLVNATMLLLPESDRARQVTMAFPGTVARDFHKKEALYNEYLEQVRAQEARGWQVRQGWLEPPVAGQAKPFQVTVTARDGSPVIGARVWVAFLRPSDQRLDQRVELPEKDSGLYRANVELPSPGLWSTTLTIERGEDVHEVQANTRIEAGAEAP
ncbi:MAG: FixH family protein [Xanthomonadaceae bacterium]|nr:FixH family protein [Xanthomonadaceae bacterium]